jgi:AcrR family transcriptional regulator
MARPHALPPHAPRWHRLPHIRPQQIMAAAAKVFARDGLHGTSLDRVAREAGITKGTIYLYYRSKEDLFLATLRRKSTEVFEALEAAGRAGGRGDFRRRLALFAEAAYRAIGSSEVLPIIQMVLAGAGRFPETAELFFREFILKNNRRLAAVLEQGMAAGELRRADSLVAARGLIGMLLVFVLSQKVLGGERVLPLSDRRILRTVTSIFLDGIAPRHARGHPRPAGRNRRTPR